MTEAVRQGQADVGGRVLRLGRQGVGSFHSPERVVGQLRAAHPRDADDQTVQRLINLHCSQSALQGAISGIGGIFTLVLTLPLSLFADGVIQARLAYAIALVYGHDPDAPETEALVAGCLVGVGGTSASALGVGAPRALVAAVRRKAARRVGAKLLTRVGGEGAARLIPVAGAAAAGAMDFALTRSVARRATEAFKH
ncbi:MAG: EcsC family protein [Actinomycetota bacterium]|nr:EcsC family protein [Actinomycetota bacterium]